MTLRPKSRSSWPLPVPPALHPPLGLPPSDPSSEICPSPSQSLPWRGREAWAKQGLQNKVPILSREGENSKQVKQAGSTQPRWGIFPPLS